MTHPLDSGPRKIHEGPKAEWILADLGDQSERTFLVTGVTSGIGFEIARELARAGGRVILAARSRDKLALAQSVLIKELPEAKLEQLIIDLADQARVRHAADRARSFGPIHTLVNNAGIMATPYGRTADGLELQMATNHFGPFALTGLLLPQLVESGDGKVVTVASVAHTWPRTPPTDEPRMLKTRYSRWQTYGHTKLANLMFTFELDRRLTAAKLPVKAVAAHPGYAATHLLAGSAGGARSGSASILNSVMSATAQSAAKGALPILMAATKDLPGSTYCGPSGWRQLRGLPRVVGTSKLAKDEAAQKRLWEISEHVTGIHYP
ncbi:oxidoreductase [Nocardioides speluncae]|uniref:oxidoreductase n=1 Tax=Nocardioides speluncae TaxID=2670337 RepID=UPI000D69FC41|nr:oxidoreductase [Nocardioides speluncae]